MPPNYQKIMYSLKFSLSLFQSIESYGPVTLTLITVHISITLSLRVGFVKMQLNLNRLVLFGIHSRFNALLLLLLSQRIWPFGCWLRSSCLVSPVHIMGLKTECEQTRSRSEYYLSWSELDTVIGNDVKIGTIYFVCLEIDITYSIFVL